MRWLRLYGSIVVVAAVTTTSFVMRCTSTVTSTMLITEGDRLIQPKTKTDVATLVVPDESLNTIYPKVTNSRVTVVGIT